MRRASVELALLGRVAPGAARGPRSISARSVRDELRRCPTASARSRARRAASPRRRDRPSPSRSSRSPAAGCRAPARAPADRCPRGPTSCRRCSSDPSAEIERARPRRAASAASGDVTASHLRCLRPSAAGAARRADRADRPRSGCAAGRVARGGHVVRPGPPKHVPAPEGQRGTRNRRKRGIGRPSRSRACSVSNSRRPGIGAGRSQSVPGHPQSAGQPWCGNCDVRGFAFRGGDFSLWRHSMDALVQDVRFALAHVRQAPGVHARRDRDAGARDWRQQRDLHRGQRGRPASRCRLRQRGPARARDGRLRRASARPTSACRRPSCSTTAIDRVSSRRSPACGRSTPT